MVVIYGPMATGKTLHSARFAKHYNCKRAIDDWDLRGSSPRSTDLILTTDTFLAAAKRWPTARLVGINVARRAIGLDPAPAEGFLAKRVDA